MLGEDSHAEAKRQPETEEARMARGTELGMSRGSLSAAPPFFASLPLTFGTLLYFQVQSQPGGVWTDENFAMCLLPLSRFCLLVKSSLCALEVP